MSSSVCDTGLFLTRKSLLPYTVYNIMEVKYILLCRFQVLVLANLFQTQDHFLVSLCSLRRPLFRETKLFHRPANRTRVQVKHILQLLTTPINHINQVKVLGSHHSKVQGLHFLGTHRVTLIKGK